MHKRNKVSHHKSAQREAPNQEGFILEDRKVKHWRSRSFWFFDFLQFFTFPGLTGLSIQQGPNGAQTQHPTEHPCCVGPSKIVHCKLHEGTHGYRTHATPGRDDTVCKTDAPSKIKTKKSCKLTFKSK